jgi:hypothetical protein
MYRFVLLSSALLSSCAASPPAPSPVGLPAPAAAPTPASPAAAPTPASPAAASGPRAIPLTCEVGPGITPLAGTLWLPAAGDGPFPTMLLFPGAAMWNRDGDLPDEPWGHYHDLALAVADAGGAAVLFDKHGTGATGGEPLADDTQRTLEAGAAEGCTQARPETDDQRLVWVGHSMGTGVAVASFLAGMHPDAGRPPGPRPRRLVLLSPVVDPEALAALPPDIAVTLVRGELDLDEEGDAARLAALGARGHQVLVPGGDHLLFDATNGTPDPKDPGTRISPVAAAAVVGAVTTGW